MGFGINEQKEMSITDDGPQICVMFYAKNKVCFCG